jgi:hypothetical protein
LVGGGMTAERAFGGRKSLDTPPLSLGGRFSGLWTVLAVIPRGNFDIMLLLG